MFVLIYVSLFLFLDSFSLSFQFRRANGCGPIYFNIDQFLRNIGEEILIDCCNEHDRCYETCGMKRLICDTTFLHCMIEACRQLSNINRCQTDGRILFWFVFFAGQSAYEQSQKDNQCIHSIITNKTNHF